MTGTTTGIQARTQKIFQNVFDNPDLVISSDMTAADVEGWDSLSHIQLILAVEKEFKVKFPAAEVVTLKSVGELLGLIEKKYREQT